MNCINCGFKNLEDSNFCHKCGFRLEINQKCEVCHEDKNLYPLLCGHAFCKSCLNSVAEINNNCPKCRKEFKICDLCGGMRVYGNQCLDCENNILLCSKCFHKYPNLPEYKILNICENCHLSNVKTITTGYHEGLNINTLSKEKVNPTLIPICKKCFSRNITLDSTTSLHKCHDCVSYILEPLIVPAHNLDLYPVISKEYINPEMVKICEICFSDNPKNFYSSLIKNKCFDCESPINGIDIPKKYKKYFKKIDRNLVNPKKIKICSKCFCQDFFIKIVDTHDQLTCKNCKSYDKTIIIFEHSKDLYQLKKRYLND